MKATILSDAEDDLELAFDYYESRRPGLGGELVEEFRRAVDRILSYPNGWQPLDEQYRRCRLHRFPFGSYLQDRRHAQRDRHRGDDTPQSVARRLARAILSEWRQVIR